MHLSIMAVIAMLASQLSIAGEKLVNVPYDPASDFSKLAENLGIDRPNVTFHSRCAYFKLNEWVSKAKLESLSTCVVVFVDDRLILATWDADRGAYVPIIDLRSSDISRAALSVEGAKHQLQLRTNVGFLAITTSKYRAPPPGDSSDVVELLRQLDAKGVTAEDSPGRVDLEPPPEIQWYYKRR